MVIWVAFKTLIWNDIILSIGKFPGVLWSGWYADDGNIHAPLAVLDQIMPVLTSAFAVCNIIVSPSKTRVVTSLPSNVEVYANLKLLRIVPLQHGFELMLL